MPDLKEMVLILNKGKKPSPPEPDGSERNTAREDLVSAFADMDNKELPAVERMEALKLFLKLNALDKDPFA